MIKEHFSNYFLRNSDVTFDIANNNIAVHQERSEPWKVTLLDTGEMSGTGGRLRQIRDYLDDDDFCFTEETTVYYDSKVYSPTQNEDYTP